MNYSPTDGGPACSAGVIWSAERSAPAASLLVAGCTLAAVFALNPAQRGGKVLS